MPDGITAYNLFFPALLEAERSEVCVKVMCIQWDGTLAAEDSVPSYTSVCVRPPVEVSTGPHPS